MKRSFLIGGIIVFSLSVFAEAPPYSRPALVWAAKNNLISLAERMLESGVTVGERDLMGNTSLHHAVRHPEMVKFLIEHGSDVNARNLLGETPLHMAVRYKEAVELLLAGGADRNIRNVFGRTAADYCMFGRPRQKTLEVLNLLYGE